MASGSETIPHEAAFFGKAQGSSMMRRSQRRTMGIITNMVGAAITQAISQEPIQVHTMPGAVPIARQVAKPETRKVMKTVVHIGRAKRR
jgi:hypothetical protein